MNQEQPAEGPVPPKKYTEEFKRSVVDHWRSSAKSAAQVAGEFGLIFPHLRVGFRGS